MKATGIIRRVDDLGRLVIPKELRDMLEFDCKKPIEFFVDDNDKVVLKKYNPGCCLCGNTKKLKEFKNKKICNECLELIKREEL